MSKKVKNPDKNTDFLNVSNDDFESPVVFKKFKSSNDKPSQRLQKRKKPNKKEKQLTLHQVYQENFNYSDVNSEHLQLALALSRSTSDTYNCMTKEEFPLVPKNEGKKTTLLEFGFRTTRPKISVENKIVRKEPLKTNKKSKFRYVTPILMMRTEEERESLIQSKLSSIVMKNTVISPECKYTIPEVSSRNLEELLCRECSIFNLNEKVVSSEAQFSIPCLNIERTRTKSGNLLKDWKKIPLRDHTPERLGKENKNFEFSENSSNDESKISEIVVGHDSVHLEENKCRDGSVSPDLFENISYNNLVDITNHNEISDQDAPDGNHLENSISNIDKCGKNCDTFIDDEIGAFSHEDIWEEKTVPNTFSKQKFEEKASSSYVYENDTSIMSRLKKLTKTHDSSPIADEDTIVLSSDEEISAPENFSSNLYLEMDNPNIEDSSKQPDEIDNGNSIENNHALHLKDLSFEQEVFMEKKNIDDEKIEENILIFDERDLSGNSSDLKLNNSFPLQRKSSNSFSECRLEKMDEFYTEKNSYDEYDSSIDRFNFPNEKASFEVNSEDGEQNNSKFDNFSNTLDDLNNVGTKLSDSFHDLDSRKNCDLEMNFSTHDHDLNCKSNKKSDVTTRKDISTEILSDSLLVNFLEENSSYLENNDNNSKQNPLTPIIELKYVWYDDSDTENQYGEFRNVSTSPSIENESKPAKDIKKSCSESIEINTPKSTKPTKIPLKKYASFCEKETPKGSTFVRHKSESNITPTQKFVVKTDNVTPMVDYSKFSTPEIVQELGRFGLKPLKRKRGINLLRHIYETTHPIVEGQKRDNDVPSGKRRKSGDVDKKCSEMINMPEVLRTWSGTVSESDAILERQWSSKVYSCQVPLQIVWHNFLNENPEIMKNILLYEPLQVEVIHKMLKDVGYKFHLQDLITFLDQKCITIRLAQNQRNKVG